MSTPSGNPPPQQRELVFCHQCENEWYRDEHGLVCPECHCDFCEVIEPDHDPRVEMEDAPDPDEDDIDQFEWRNNAPGEPPGGHLHGHIHRTITLGPGGQGQGQGGSAMGGLMGLLGPALQGILGNATQQQPQRRTPAGGEEGETGEDASHNNREADEQQQGDGRTFVRTGQGPGYAYSITTSSNVNLRPRNADMPQPFQDQPVEIGAMMQRMIANIGVMPIHGPPQHGGHGHPVAMGVHGGPMAIDDLLAMFNGMGAGGGHGDAVYSQQEYDRVISQLMEQHAAGHAPPPASEDAIDSLPKKQISREDLDDKGKADCSICINEVNLGDEVTVLPCSHWFHHECVKAWLISHDTCPHCRKGIMPKDEPTTTRPRNPDQAPHHDLHAQESQPPPTTGIFNRMREAFGSGSNSARDGTAGNGNTSGNDATRPAHD